MVTNQNRYDNTRIIETHLAFDALYLFRADLARVLLIDANGLEENCDCIRLRPIVIDDGNPKVLPRFLPKLRFFC